MRSKKIKAVSLFSGCGGSDFALQSLGYDVVWANDVWQEATLTYKDNLPHAKVECGDIRDFDHFPSAELLVGCYPCQGFTQGGRRKWGEALNFLYQEFDRVLRLVRPSAFIVENVNGMTYGQNSELLRNQLTRYRLAGYHVKWQTLNAQEFGVAQHRKRVFLVGVRSDMDFDYEFPQPTHGPAAGIPFVSQRNVLSGLPDWPDGEFNKEPFHWYYMSRNRRHDWDEPSPCIVGHWRHVPLHPLSPPLCRIGPDEWRFSEVKEARRFSYRECALLQGFHRRFTFVRGTIRDRFQMIGNAVPPPLFAAVAAQLSPLWS
jgi:DNA (cytosine-5)-methyltransferase 1